MKTSQRLLGLARRVIASGPPDFEEITRLLEAAPETQDFDAIYKLIGQSLGTVEGWESKLRQTLAETRAFEAKIASERQYSEVWWGVRCREIEAALREHPDVGMSELARSFADALIAGEREMSRRIATHAWPAPAGAEEAFEVLRRLGYAVEAYGLGTLPHMLERVARLAWPPGAQALLDPSRQAAMLVLAGRVLLGQGYTEWALERVQAAALRDPESALVHAALGDVRRAMAWTEEAVGEYRRALEAGRDRPDAFLGLGAAAEARGAISEAREWYETAARAAVQARTPRHALSAMLTGVPGAGHLALAQALALTGERGEEALAAVEEALEAGLSVMSGFDYAEAYTLRGELLARAGHTSEAARARSDAGCALLDRDDAQAAAGELRIALELDPALPVAYRGLAEALRATSYAADPLRPDARVLDESFELWMRGYELEPPPPDEAWTYNVAGLVVEERGRLPPTTRPTAAWEAIGWIERGLAVTDPAEAAGNGAAWSQLARVYSGLGLTGCALEVARGAVAVAEHDPTAWYWYATALTNCGDYDEAAGALERAEALGGAPYNEIRDRLQLKRGERGVVGEPTQLSGSLREPDPVRELELALTEYERDASVAWAVWMALGRVHRAQERWEQAADAYARAGTIEPRGPEAEAGIRATIARLCDPTRAPSPSASSDSEGARSRADRWALGRRIADGHLQGDTALGGTLAACEGGARVLGGQREAGFALLATARRELPGDARAVGSAIADACAYMAGGAPDLWMLRRAFAELHDASPDDADVWQAATEAADRRAHAALGLLEEDYAPMDLRPVVRLGAGLIPQDTGPSWVLFTDHLPAMRTRIEVETGVTLPGIIFREMPGDAPGGYEIELDGLVQIVGVTQLGCVFSALSVPHLGALGIPAERLIEAPDPVTGRPGAWIAEADRELAGDQAEPCVQPLAYVVLRLEAVLRANLGGLIDLDRVESLLDMWSLDPEGARAVEELLPSRRDRIRFSRLVRDLVSEMVPVADWRDVLEPLGEGAFGERPIEPAVAAIRRALGERLPGGDRSLRRVNVPREWIEEIAGALQGRPAGRGTGPPAAVRALRERLPPGLDADTVLVAPDTSSRVLLRGLMTVVAPYVPVIAIDELEQTDGGPGERAPVAEQVDHVV